MNTSPSVPARPMLRRDVVFLQLQDGLLVKADEGTFKLRGAAAYQYVSALLPFLDGEHLLDDLVGGLPAAHGDSVRSLLGALHSRGAVIDRVASATDLPGEVTARFADQLALLAHHGDSSAALHRVATHHVLVVGPAGAAVPTLVASLRNNGFGAMSGRLTSVIGDELRLPVVADDELAAADLVVLVSPEQAVPGAVDLAVRAARLGVPFVSVLRVGEEVLVGPAQTDQPLLQHALLRMADNEVTGAAELLLEPTVAGARITPAAELPPGAVDLPVSLCAFEVFKLVSGVMPSELQGAAVFFDAERIETTSEVLVQHPGLAGPDAPPVLPDEPDEQLSLAEQRLAAFTPLINDHLGLARRFHDDDVPQIPVKTGILSAPVLGGDPVVGYSVDDVAAARVRALEAFAARYSLAVLERAATGPSDDSIPAVPAASITTALVPPPGRLPTLTAHDLDGSPVRVPAAAVLTGPRHLRRSWFRPDLAGLAAGQDLAQARTASLLSAVQAWTAQEVLAGRLAVTAQARPAGAGTETERLLLTATETFGVTAHPYRVSGALVPTVLVVAGSTAVLRSGATWQDATQAALVEVVGHLQLARHGQEIPSGSEGLLAGAAEDIRVISPDVFEDAPDRPLPQALRAAGLGGAWLELTAPDLRGITSVVRTVLFRQDVAEVSRTTGPGQ